MGVRGGGEGLEGQGKGERGNDMYKNLAGHWIGEGVIRRQSKRRAREMLSVEGVRIRMIKIMIFKYIANR